MKEVHFSALKEIESKFGVLERVDDEATHFQIGWKVNLGEEKATFNFTQDGVRIFKLEKSSEKSKYKGLENLRQCAKKAGLEHLVYYAIDEDDDTGAEALDLVGAIADGLDDIAEYYKTHATTLDEMGGSVRRIGSRRR